MNDYCYDKRNGDGDKKQMLDIKQIRQRTLLRETTNDRSFSHSVFDLANVID